MRPVEPVARLREIIAHLVGADGRENVADLEEHVDPQHQDAHQLGRELDVVPSRIVDVKLHRPHEIVPRDRSSHLPVEDELDEGESVEVRVERREPHVDMRRLIRQEFPVQDIVEKLLRRGAVQPAVKVKVERIPICLPDLFREFVHLRRRVVLVWEEPDRDLRAGDKLFHPRDVFQLGDVEALRRDVELPGVQLAVVYRRLGDESRVEAKSGPVARCAEAPVRAGECLDVLVDDFGTVGCHEARLRHHDRSHQTVERRYVPDLGGLGRLDIDRGPRREVLPYLESGGGVALEVLRKLLPRDAERPHPPALAVFRGTQAGD
mmetsp:Transcript_42958/g.102184  ORF Transcript_42958/g.102184 Transcript_42958/m.102184 type:complete len:321 (-) Transcript_42958:1645-2607(-)